MNKSSSEESKHGKSTDLLKNYYEKVKEKQFEIIKKYKERSAYL